MYAKALIPSVLSLCLMTSRVTSQDVNNADMERPFHLFGYNYMLLGRGQHLYPNDSSCNGQVPAHADLFLQKMLKECNITPLSYELDPTSPLTLLQLGKDNPWRCGTDQLWVDIINEDSPNQGCLRAYMEETKQDGQSNGAVGQLPDIAMIGLAGVVYGLMAM